MRLAVLTLALAGLLAFATPPADAQTTIRLGHSNAPTSPKGRAADKFATLVDKYSGGRVTVKIFPSSQLGNNRKLFTAVKTRGIEMSLTPYPLLADIVPEFTTLTAGYFYDNWNQLRKILDHPELGQTWAKTLLEKGRVRILSTYYYGARNLTTANKKVLTPADLEGLKIRAVPNEMSLGVVTGMGASPTPVSLAEAFQAMRQGVVDGQENPLPTIWSQRFYEVQKYLMITRHQHIPEPYLINESVWKKLSAEDQQAVSRAAVEAAEFNTAETLKFEESLIDDLKAKGMTIIPAEELDIDAFRTAVRSEVIKRFDGPIWPKGTADKVLSTIQ